MYGANSPPPTPPPPHTHTPPSHPRGVYLLNCDDTKKKKIKEKKEEKNIGTPEPQIGLSDRPKRV